MKKKMAVGILFPMEFYMLPEILVVSARKLMVVHIMDDEMMF